MTSPRAGSGPVRPILVLGLALLIAFQLVRSAAVSQPFAKRPAWAATLWPGHPQIQLDRSMTAIGTAAARREKAPAGTDAVMLRVARQSPLEPAPFLVTGAIAQTAGRNALAARLFLHARDLDPRAPAARYFLADHYLRTGQVPKGLSEMAVLARLTPDSNRAFVPALAAYALTPGSFRPLSAFLNASPETKPLVLQALAEDPDNADLVLRLAGPPPHPAIPATLDWQRVLLAKVVAAGDFARAYSIWGRLTGAGTPGGALYNPGFRKLAAPPPFNWTFHAGPAGVAEPAAGNRLQILYYGRENAALAQQLLILRPGLYRLGMTAAGDAGPGGIAWLVRCHPADRPILELPVKAGRNAATFVVPADGCRAQSLELVGRASDSPRQADLILGDLTLVRRAGS